MSARPLKKLRHGASAAVMAQPDIRPQAVHLRLADADMGDSGSASALARLNDAMAELKLLSVKPFLNRAIDCLNAGDFKRGADWALKALKKDEKSGWGWYLLAIAREKARDFIGSMRCYEKALQLMPDHAEVANDLGRLAFRMDMKEEAAKLFAHYRATHPDHAESTNNLACALRDLHEYDKAIDLVRDLLMRKPEEAILWNTLGTTLAARGDSADSLIFFDEALRLDPDFAKALYNRSNARIDIGDIEGSLEDCERAQKGNGLSPQDAAMMELARSTMLLCLGRVAEGWEAYEARLSPEMQDSPRFLTDKPQWTPDTDIEGKSLLIFAEQGLGDEVMFANLFPDVIEALGPKGKLTAAVEKRLVPLFQRSFSEAHITPHYTKMINMRMIRAAPKLGEMKDIDLWAPMGSLLRRFRPSVESFPNRPAFMTPDPERVAHWREQLAAAPAGPKVGILWKSLKLEGIRLRQFSPFHQWREVLTTPGVTFVNLQYGDCEAELLAARREFGVNIWQPPEIDLKKDLDDVAALCCALDLVVGFANATINLAGACGAPIFLISAPAAWAKMGTDRYPWYPQARSFAPTTFNQWEPVMAEVAGALRARFS